MTRRRAPAALASAAGALILLAFFVRGAGTWLVVTDALQPARAIVVLVGQVPFRAKEAAAIYKQGWTHEVWLTTGRVTEEDEALAQLGIDLPVERVYSRLVLERLGVPKGSIREIGRSNANTADELRTIAGELRAVGGDRVILMTSKYHTRRVRALWRTRVGAWPAAIVRYTPDDPFEPDRWWRTTTDAMVVSREWLGLLNAWVGFPMKTER